MANIQAAPRPKHPLNSLFFTFSRNYSHGFLRHPRHLFHLRLWLQWYPNQRRWRWQREQRVLRCCLTVFLRDNDTCTFIAVFSSHLFNALSSLEPYPNLTTFNDSFNHHTSFNSFVIHTTNALIHSGFSFDFFIRRWKHFLVAHRVCYIILLLMGFVSAVGM